MDSSLKRRLYLYEFYIEAISSHLNEIHKESHSSSYWEQLIGPWLFSFIWYLSYRFESTKPFDLTNASNEQAFPVPYDFLSFICLFEKTKYAEALEYYIRYELDIDRINNWQCFKIKPVNDKRKATFLKAIISYLSRYWIGFAEIIMVSTHIKFLDQLRIFVHSNFRIVPFYFPEYSSDLEVIDLPLRSWVRKRTSFTSRLDYLIYNIVLLQLPVVHLETYPFLKAQLPIRTSSLKAIFSATGWTMNEEMKLLAADKYESGVLRIGMQHGGNPYGTGDSKFVDLEESLVDFFLTWGWKYSPKHIPFYAFRFSCQRLRLNSSIIRHDEILYICTDGSKFQSDQAGIPSGGQYEEVYLADQLRFLRALSEIDKAKLVVRLNPHEKLYNWNIEKRLNSLNLNLIFENTDPLPVALQRAKLVVCDNFYSTFTQSMILGVPALLFVNTNIFKLNKKFLNLFDKMIEVGLAHTSTLSAINHIQDISYKPDKWWNSKSVVCVREKFLDNYGKISFDPVTDLVDILDRIIH